MRNPAVEWDEDADASELVLTVPRRQTPTVNFIAWALGVPKERRLALDEMGSFVWRHCDGQQTVREIVEALIGRYKLSHREATVSLTTYLHTLGRRSLVAFAVDKSLIAKEKRPKEEDDQEEEGPAAMEKKREGKSRERRQGRRRKKRG